MAKAVAPDDAPTATGSIWRRLIVLALCIAAVAAYHNSFDGAFLLDDQPRITENPQIRRLWPLSSVMAGSTRPFLQISLALNYAISQNEPWTYHLFNLVTHVLAGVVLFGLVRRMFESKPLRSRYGGAAAGLAGAAAGIWLLHPMQTQSVTYIIQRAESLASLLFLLTLYCAVRAFTTSALSSRWAIAAVIASALGMGTKEMMVSAPLMVLLYDRTFVTGSFKDALRTHWPLYAGLAATWIVLAISLLASRVEEQMYLVADVDPLYYAFTQTEVIGHYLQLALWPRPLVFDYAWPPATSLPSVLPSAVVILAGLGATLYLLVKRMWQGFWGAWFFAILAPTSSIMPIADIAVEHRMYLPLAAVVVLAVTGLFDVMRRAAAHVPALGNARAWLLGGVLIAVLAALGLATIRRNEDYRSAIAMWSDVVAKRPHNPRAHNNLGVALVKKDRIDDALTQYAEAVRLKPDYVDARNNLGATLAKVGRHEEAIVQLREAVRLRPIFADAQANLGTALTRVGRTDEAVTHLSRALNLKPDSVNAHNALGTAFYLQGKYKEAIAEYGASIRLDPTFAEGHHNLGLAVLELGETDRAIGHFSEAIRRKPDYAKAHSNLGILLHNKGQTKEAIAHFTEALRIDPGFAEARKNLQALGAAR